MSRRLVSSGVALGVSEIERRSRALGDERGLGPLEGEDSPSVVDSSSKLSILHILPALSGGAFAELSNSVSLRSSSVSSVWKTTGLGTIKAASCASSACCCFSNQRPRIDRALRRIMPSTRLSKLYSNFSRKDSRCTRSKCIPLAVSVTRSNDPCRSRCSSTTSPALIQRHFADEASIRQLLTCR